MDRETLLEFIRAALREGGFAVSEPFTSRWVSFDLLARRGEDILIIKALVNVDTLRTEQAEDIRYVSRLFGAHPLVVGLRSGSGDLEDGVVYTRHRLPIITPGTLYEAFVMGEAPYVIAAPGGYYVTLDSEALRELRKRRGLSLGQVAEMIGVTRKTVQLYEEGMKATVEAAVRIEEALGVEVVRPVDLLADFPPHEEAEVSPDVGEFEALVAERLVSLGYRILFATHCPFDVLAEHYRRTFLTGMEESTRRLKDRARYLSQVSRILEKDAFIVIRKGRAHNVEGTPIITWDEMLCVREGEEVIRLVEERRAE
jgi:putative transcriptional regulator